jgi:hypothetical protein
MRKLPVYGLALSIGLLMFGPIAQAREKSPHRQAAPRSPKIEIGGPGGNPIINLGDTPNPGGFLLFFRHLAGLDATADQAVAAGNPGASQWRSYEQRMAGLTAAEGSILKEVAYACNQALSDYDAEVHAEATASAEPPTGRMQIGNSAVDQLNLLLGDEAFQKVAQRVQALFGNVDAISASNPPGPLPPSELGDLGPPVAVDDSLPHTDAYSQILKIDEHTFYAECLTAPQDDLTIYYYLNGKTSCQMYPSGMAPVDIGCNVLNPGYCSSTFPNVPGQTFFARGFHALRMRFRICSSEEGDYDCLDDPLHYGSPPGTQLPDALDGIRIYAPGGPEVFWPATYPNDAWLIAATHSTPVTLLNVSPRQVTLYPNGVQRFISNIPAKWYIFGPDNGPGTIDINTGVFTAPASITSAQTTTIEACDADPKLQPYLVDCVIVTVNLQPLKVEVSPATAELLPDLFTTFFATVTPSTPVLHVEWSLSTRGSDPTGTFTGTSNAAAIYTAPKNDDMTVTEQITIKACVKPDPNGAPVCGTALVTIPKFQLYVVADKKTLVTGESEPFTAFVNSTTSTFQKINWQPLSTTFQGTFNAISDDTLQAVYKAPDFHSSVDIKVCLQASQSTCSAPTYPFHLEIVNPVTISSVTGTFNAGETAHFTISGAGFGAQPAVQFTSLQAAVLSSSDSLIDGLVVIPVALGGSTTKASVKVNYPNGDFITVNWPTSIPIARASVQVVPATVQLHAGETQQFSPICLTASAAACTSPDTVSWQASQGMINSTGKYTAPSSVTTSATATVTACWSGGICATAQVTLLPTAGVTVTVSPKTATVQTGHTQPFSAQVTGSTNATVTWSLNPSSAEAGNITQTGVYSAPATLGSVTTVTVIATSQADTTKQDTATVTLTAAPTPLTLTSTPSPASATYGTSLIWTAHASGGNPATTQYAFFRRRSGTVPWTPDVTSPAWQTSNILSWTPAAADVGTWETNIWVKDGNTPANANTYGYAAAYNPGPVQVTAPLTLSGTGSPASATYGTTLTWTANASGGNPATTQYAFFRRRSGTVPWTPDVTSPAWQTSNVLSWTPAAADVGSWDTYIWVKDGNTPATMNTYGYAAGYNPGPVQITAALTLTGTGSPASATYGTTLTWTANASGGNPATTQYAFFRRRSGTVPWTPDVTAPAWQTSNVLSWSPAAADVGSWDTYIWVKDGNTPATMNTYGYAAGYNPGPVQITAALTLTGTGSPASATYGTTLTWTANASGGNPATIQYAFFRRLSGASFWIPDVNSPAWQVSNVYSWTPTAADVGSWDIYIWVKDGNTPANANTYGFAAGFNSGGVQITAPVLPLTLTGTPSPASSPYGTTLTWTAIASGGTPATTQYALFRRLAGTGPWTPDVTSPAWQMSNVLTWTPGAADAGTWETYIWVKDGNTPFNMNTYGFAAGYNPGPVQITGVSQLYPAQGWVDGYNNQHIWGWACDPDYPTQSNRVDIGIPNGPGLGSSGAFLASNAGVTSACLGGTAHGFDFYPSGGIPSGTHFNVWSIDLPYATPGNDNRKISGNGAIGDGTEFVIP